MMVYFFPSLLTTDKDRWLHLRIEIKQTFQQGIYGWVNIQLNPMYSL